SQPQPAKNFYEKLPTYASTETERMREAMQADGFVLIRAVLDPPEVQTAREKIDSLEPIHWDFTGLTDHYKHVFNGIRTGCGSFTGPGSLTLPRRRSAATATSSDALSALARNASSVRLWPAHDCFFEACSTRPDVPLVSDLQREHY